MRLPQSGVGHLTVHSCGSSAAISTCTSTYPLKLLSPPCRPSQKAALVFMMSYGGGLVAGDRVNLHVTVEPNARLALLTQGSTKVYKTLGLRSSQSLTATVEDAALVLLPDPVQPFRDSAFEQRQVFQVTPASSLLVLDWVSAGRTARGEKWECSECRTRNEIWMDGRLLLRDNLVLQDRGDIDMDGLEVFGMLVIRGPVFAGLGEFFLREYSGLPRVHFGPGEECRWTAGAVRGSVVVKFGSLHVDSARRWLRQMLLTDGTIEREFGNKALLSLH